MNYSLILTVDDSIIVWSHNTMPLNILNSNCPLPTMRHTPCEHPPWCPTWKCHLRTTCLVAAPGQCIAALGMSLSNELCFCDPKNLVIRAGSSPTYFDVCLAASSHGPVIAVLLLEGKPLVSCPSVGMRPFLVTHISCRPSWSLESTCFIDEFC